MPKKKAVTHSPLSRVDGDVFGGAIDVVQDRGLQSLRLSVDGPFVHGEDVDSLTLHVRQVQVVRDPIHCHGHDLSVTLDRNLCVTRCA